MNTPSFVDVKTLSTITVSFNPDIRLLENQLRALPTACIKFIVDNASRPELISEIETAAGRVANTCLLRNDTNLGLAAAVNRGVKAASELPVSPHFVLLLDQDSEPQSGSIETMIEAFQALEAAGHNVGCVGPQLQDPDTGLTHGFHQCTRWRWKRVYPSPRSTTSVACASLNGSGTLVRVALFLQLGGLDSALFIDHVDTEWSFRILSAGYTLWGIPNAIFNHRMGQTSARFWWFGWHLWPSRSPQRHYYLFRNAIMLMRRRYVPRVWKLWVVAKLIITCILTVIIGPLRCQQAKQMGSGVRNGLTFKGTSDG